MGWLKGTARMKAPSNRLLVVSYGSLTSYSELNCLEFSFCQQNLENSRFCRENRENSRFFRKNLDCKTVRIFSYSSTREQSNKRSGTRLKTEIEESRACEARTKLRHALPITDFEKKKPTVLQSKRISKIQDSRVPKNLESTRGISAVDATRILYTKLEQLVHRSTESQKFLSFLWYFAWRFSMDSF